MSAAKDAEFCKEVERMERETAELKLQLSAAKMRERELEKSGAELKAQISAAHLSLADSARKSEEAALQAAAKVEDATIARVNDEVSIFTYRYTFMLRASRSTCHLFNVSHSAANPMDEVCAAAQNSPFRVHCRTTV